MAFKDELANKPFTGWTQGYRMNNPTVLDLDAVKKTYEDLENWANDIDSSCTPGRIVSVIGDDTGKNGVYVVGSTKRETGEDAIIIKISNLDKENNIDFSLLRHVIGSLPPTPAVGDENKIHLVHASSIESTNIFEEYVWIPAAFICDGSEPSWEKIGTLEVSTDVDLSNYYTKTQVDNLITSITNKVDTLEVNYTILGSAVEELDKKLTDHVNDPLFTSYDSTTYTLTLSTSNTTVE